MASPWARLRLFLEKRVDTRATQPANVTWIVDDMVKTKESIATRRKYGVADADYGLFMELFEACFTEGCPPNLAVYRCEIEKLKVCVTLRHKVKTGDVTAVEKRVPTDALHKFAEVMCVAAMDAFDINAAPNVYIQRREHVTFEAGYMSETVWFVASDLCLTYEQRNALRALMLGAGVIERVFKDVQLVGKPADIFRPIETGLSVMHGAEWNDAEPHNIIGSATLSRDGDAVWDALAIPGLRASLNTPFQVENAFCAVSRTRPATASKLAKHLDKLRVVTETKAWIRATYVTARWHVVLARDVFAAYDAAHGTPPTPRGRDDRAKLIAISMTALHIEKSWTKVKSAKGKRNTFVCYVDLVPRP